ncbi:FAD-dependent monooxygenase [Kitasatospora sp. NPDC057965]|uniref:FAD-dependent monooxygenase n=1 Tax=Kitasatospora sp. NPDC057965 TaxID=3346291 RepID=UPI0036D7F241
MSGTHTDVLIVGAGPVGLVTGCELLQRGARVRLVDAERRFTRHSRANVLWPRIMELLDRTDVTRRLIGHGHPVSGVGYYSRGRRIGEVPMGGTTRYPFALVISQNTVEEVLRARFAELGGTIESGLRLTALDRTSPDGSVLATLEDDAGTVRTVRSDWLVGADGAHSTTRQLLGVEFDGDVVDVSFAVADAPVSGAPDDDLTYYCYSPDGGLALGPFGEGVWRLAITVPHQEPGTPPPGREVFQQAVDARAPGQPVVGELRWSAVFRARCRIAATFRVGRCLLAGDAAHITSPAGGQGMNTGIQDAVNLGWRLAGVVDGSLHEDVLDHYDHERRAAAHFVARTTTAQTKWGMARTPKRILLRDGLFHLAHRAGLLRRSVTPLVSQLGVRYDTPASSRSEAPGLRAGDRVPLPLTPVNGRRLIARDEPGVLLWPGRTRPADWERVKERLLKELAGLAPVVEPDALVRRRLRAALGSSPLAVVVRPDGHLAAAVPPEDPDAVVRALHRLGVRPDRPDRPQEPTPTGGAR